MRKLKKKYYSKNKTKENDERKIIFLNIESQISQSDYYHHR